MSRILPWSKLYLFCPLPLLLGCAETSALPTTSNAGAGGGSSSSGSVTARGGNTSSTIGIGVDGGTGGCTGSCTTKPGTLVVAYCGDGLLNQAGEVCDDANRISGDGCTAGCDQVEVGFVCSTPGVPCESNVKCGDGRIGGTETCDFGTQGPSVACNAQCQLQPGWVCPVAGLPCMAALCGDGLLVGAEECEFTTDAPPVGCTSVCRIEVGYDCDPATHLCAKTACGNQKTERGEQCDDGNALPFDGCYQCRLEPSCANGQCAASCGDGQRFATEDCDDGNTRSGDGCSSTCAIETGFTCQDQTLDPTTSMNVPVLIRDFVGLGRELAGHAAHRDFNQYGACPTMGMLESLLSPTDGRPQLFCPGGDCTKNPSNCLESRWSGTSALFDQWYRNVSGVNIPIAKVIPLARQTDGTYRYDSDNPATTALEPFDLITQDGWVALAQESVAPAATCGTDRNVSFTSETHFWFQYQGGERFDFSGDDDTWVYVNSRLVIDLGGLHQRMDGYFILDADTDGTAAADTADGTAAWASPDGATHMNGAPSPASPVKIPTGMTPGGIYEVTIYQAERKQCESNFRVTMKNFTEPRSACTSVCGDGVVSSNELCDDGTNVSLYNGCAKGCLPAPFCGDGIVQAGLEDCDNGVNTSLYGGCAPGCKRGPSCGDGLVQSPYEQCDDGTNDGGYKECAANCVYGERCGDGVLQAKYEQCDDGPNNGTGNCNFDCTSRLVL